MCHTGQQGDIQQYDCEGETETTNPPEETGMTYQKSSTRKLEIVQSLGKPSSQ